MGKGTIVAPIGAGQYWLKLNMDWTRITKRLKAIDARTAVIAHDRVNVSSGTDLALIDYNLAMNTLNQILKDMADASTDAYRQALNDQITALEQQITTLRVAQGLYRTAHPDAYDDAIVVLQADIDQWKTPDEKKIHVADIDIDGQQIADLRTQQAEYRKHHPDQWDIDLAPLLYQKAQLEFHTFENLVKASNAQLVVVNAKYGLWANWKRALDALDLQWSALKLEKGSLEKTEFVDPVVAAWCVDYSAGFKSGDTVGTAEVPWVTSDEGAAEYMQNKRIDPSGLFWGDIAQIKPGYNVGQVYVNKSDGMLQKALAGTPSSDFYNLAMLLGWEKWRPTYRYGTITAIDYDANTCTVELDAVFMQTVDNVKVNVNASAVEIAAEKPEEKWGWLTVNILPADAVIGGAKWGVNYSDWKESGATIAAGKTDAFFIVLKDDLELWKAPAAPVIKIESGKVTITSVKYTPAWGWVTVGIGPAPIQWQTAWSIDGGTTWNYNGQTLTVLAGRYTVIFSDLPGWTKPANMAVTVVKDSSLEVEGDYT